MAPLIATGTGGPLGTGNICSLPKARARTSIRRVIKLSHATESGIPPLLLIKEIEMNTVQRAFELAATGDCRSLEDVRIRMRRESLEQVDAHLAGPTIRSQLAAIMHNASARA